LEKIVDRLVEITKYIILYVNVKKSVKIIIVVDRIVEVEEEKLLLLKNT
jgi:hypothetical protein